jgi:hypothetical protein
MMRVLVSMFGFISYYDGMGVTERVTFGSDGSSEGGTSEGDGQRGGRVAG